MPAGAESDPSPAGRPPDGADESRQPASRALDSEEARREACMEPAATLIGTPSCLAEGGEEPAARGERRDVLRLSRGLGDGGTSSPQEWLPGSTGRGSGSEEVEISSPRVADGRAMTLIKELT